MNHDLAHESVPPLAWDHQGLPFQTPPEAIAFKVREYTGKPGRPPVVWDGNGPMHVDLGTTMQEFRKMVEAGSYRLYPVDIEGNELTPIACIEVVPEYDEGAPQSLARIETAPPVVESEALTASGRMYDILERMIASRDSHDAVLSTLLTTLVQSTAAIQQSTAALLQAANTTVQVANGTEAIEPPELDIHALSERLSTLLAPAEEPAKPAAPWFVQLLSGPLGVGLMQFAQGFAQSVAAAQARKAAPPADAPQPAPVPPARPMPPSSEPVARPVSPAPVAQPVVSPEPVAQPVVSVEPVAQPIVSPEPVARPIVSAEPVVLPEPVSQPEPTPRHGPPTPVAQPEPITQPEPVARPEPTPRHGSPEPVVQPVPTEPAAQVEQPAPVSQTVNPNPTE